MRIMNQSDAGPEMPIIPINDYNEMVKAIENIYTHLKTNRAHLYSIENKAEALVRRLESLLPPPPEETVAPVEVDEEPVEEVPPEPEPEEPEEGTPFLAWGRGEPCPVCGAMPPTNAEVSVEAWSTWTLEHIKEHAEASA